MMFYKINAGHKAVDNGAQAPLTQLFSLAAAMGQSVITGRTYGDDYLRIPSDAGDRAAVEALLCETKLLWEVVPELPPHLSGYA